MLDISRFSLDIYSFSYFKARELWKDGIPGSFPCILMKLYGSRIIPSCRCQASPRDLIALVVNRMWGYGSNPFSYGQLYTNFTKLKYICLRVYVRSLIRCESLLCHIRSCTISSPLTPVDSHIHFSHKVTRCPAPKFPNNYFPAVLFSRLRFYCCTSHTFFGTFQFFSSSFETFIRYRLAEPFKLMNDAAWKNFFYPLRKMICENSSSMFKSSSNINYI